VQTGRALAGGDSSEHARFQPASSLRRHACCHGVITYLSPRLTIFFSSVFMTACKIRRDGSHIHGAQYCVDRWTAIVANAVRFKCYRRVRPLTVGERWGKSTRLEKTSIQAFHTSLPRFGVIAHSSIPSLLGAVFPHGRPSGLGAFPAIAGQRSVVATIRR
jgi:hypothetical protein